MPYFAGGRDRRVAANDWQEKAPTEVGAEVERICKPNDLAEPRHAGLRKSLNPQLQWTFLILVKVWLDAKDASDSGAPLGRKSR